MGQGPAGILKGRGKFAEAFKCPPRSSCPRRRGAAHATLLRPLTLALTTRLAGAARVPKALRAPSSRSRPPRAALGLGNRMHQEVSSPTQSTPKRFQGKGARNAQGGAFPQPSAKTGGRLVSRDVSAVPLHSTFLLRWGRDRKLLEVPGAPLPLPGQSALGL